MGRPDGAEMEGKGLDYERMALHKLFARQVEDYGIETVCEVPARGEKAMPSIYSLPFAAVGCDVTLVNHQPRSMWAWDELGLSFTPRDEPVLHETSLPDASFDLVWDFMYLCQYEDPGALLDEMRRLSKRYVMFVAVNRFNPGFLSHRMVHKVSGVPWNHGDPRFMSPFFGERFFAEHGLKRVERGWANCPPYPDSLGFRDMKLHRKNVDLHEIDWDSRTVGWMQTGQYPKRFKFYYFFEWAPVPSFIKMFYAHLYYILAEKA